MGQKVNPIGLRLGIVETWRSNWFAADKDFRSALQEDVRVRSFLFSRFPRGTVSRIDIDKVSNDRVRIRVHTTRPGVILGRKGSEINKVRDELYQMLNRQVAIDVIEVAPPGQSAPFVADTIAMQLEKRTPHRQVVKKAIQLALQSGAKGVKVRVSGRIGGAEISRSEQYKEGKVPLHTLRAKIDYATSTAVTKSGTVGVKVWIYLGEQFTDETKAVPPAAPAAAPAEKPAPNPTETAAGGAAATE